MIKVINVVKRKPGISREEFYKYWKDHHGPLVARSVPTLRKYIQNHFIELPGREYEGDGIIEMWFDSLDVFQKTIPADKTKKPDFLLEDWAKIADMSPPKQWVVEEHVIKDETK